jgi:hypothetical protein
MFPVRYELNFYIVFRRNSVFKGLISISWLFSSVAIFVFLFHSILCSYCSLDVHLEFLDIFIQQTKNLPGFFSIRVRNPYRLILNFLNLCICVCIKPTS